MVVVVLHKFRFASFTYPTSQPHDVILTNHIIAPSVRVCTIYAFIMRSFHARCRFLVTKNKKHKKTERYDKKKSALFVTREKNLHGVYTRSKRRI